MSTVVIERLDGTTYDLDAMGFHVKKFDVPLTNYSYNYQQVGKFGALLTSAQAQQLVIPLTLDITAHDLRDYNLQLLQIRKIFLSSDDFYVRNMIMPHIRWRCRAESVTPTQNGNFWRATNVAINLDVPSGFAESVATTKDAVDFGSGQWGFGENIPDCKIDYSYSTNDFSFWNLGIIPLTADERPVTITFQGDAPNGFTITNTTTKQSYKITRGLSYSDKVVIVGVMPSFNGTQSYKDCDHGFIDYVPGENKMHIDGVSNFTLSYETRFYY